MPAWWIVPAVQAATSAVQYATRKKAPSFDSTAYGKELRRTKKEGAFGPEATSNILNQVGRTAGASAQKEQARIRGSLEAGGLGGSIAGQRLLSAPGRDRTRALTTAASNISTQNEITKNQASREFAVASDRSRENARLENNQSRSDLLGGLASAGASAVTSRLQYGQELELNKGMAQVQTLMDAGDDDAAENLILMLIARYGNAN